MARRTKSQARRHGGDGGFLPGWAWLVIGVVLTIVTILAAPRILQRQGEDSFFRPRANPDAQPVTTRSGDETEDTGAERASAGDDDPTGAQSRAAADEQVPQYDFYDLLPGEEVAMSDAQLAAAARNEAERARREQQRLAQEQAARDAGMRPHPLPETPAAPAAATAPVATAGTTMAGTTTIGTPAGTTTTIAPPSAPTVGNQTPYILQAGAFAASGDAEAVKAKIAMLGLNARVESAHIGGKTVYRVRMGPYGSASELATAKGKLSTGGLPALAIKAR